MAAENTSAQELADTYRKLQEEILNYGRAYSSTQEAHNAAVLRSTTGIDNIGTAVTASVTAFAQLGGGIGKLTKSVMAGERGMAAMNGAVDSMADAAKSASMGLLAMLGPVGPVMKILMYVVTAAIDAIKDYVKAVNQMNDQLYKGYSKIAKAGGGAADGMTGLEKGVHKLGMTMEDLDGIVSLIGENSQMLASFSGSVGDGRKALENMGEGMGDFRKDMLVLGQSATDVSEGMVNYMKQVQRTGLAQVLTSKQMEEGAKKYILEQDTLTRITGLNAQKQQALMDQAAENEQFQGKIQELKARAADGDAAAAEQVKALEKGLKLAAAKGPEMAEAFMASVNGNFRNVAAQKLFNSTMGDAAAAMEDLKSGAITAEEYDDRINKSVAVYQKTLGNSMSQLDAGAQTQLKISTMTNSTNLANMSTADRAKKAEEDRLKALSDAGDPLAKQNAEMLTAQIKSKQSIEDLYMKSMPKANEAMITLAKVTLEAAKGLNRLFGDEKAGQSKPMSEAEAKAKQNKASESALADADKAKAVLNDKNATPEQKAQAKKTAEESEAQVAQASRDQREAQLAAQNERRKKEKQARADALMGKTPSSAAAGGNGAAPAGGSGAAPAASSSSGTVPSGRAPAGTENNKPAITLPSSSGSMPAAQEAKSSKDVPNSVSSQLVSMLKGMEKFTPKAFWDFKQYSIGYGTKASDPNESITEPEAANRLKEAIDGASKLVADFGKKNGYQWGQNQVDALSSFVYNGGPGFLTQVTGDGKRKNEEIAKAIPLYNQAGGKVLPGLESRRALEAGLFAKDLVTAESGVQVEGPNSGYPATLHGKEAVIPMQNGSGDFVKMFERIADSNMQMVEKIDELVRTQRNSNDIQTKILRAQA